jgi:hypothetical protein
MKVFDGLVIGEHELTGRKIFPLASVVEFGRSSSPGTKIGAAAFFIFMSSLCTLSFSFNVCVRVAFDGPFHELLSHTSAAIASGGWEYARFM